MKKNKISKNWIKKHYRDPFVRASKIKGYRSRSAFKLIEINEKFNFLKKNIFLLDLGSSPGGWSQVAIEKIMKGKILAVDLKQMKKITDVNFLLGDFQVPAIQERVQSFFGGKIDAVISDMASDTTGNKSVDSIRTGELCLSAMRFAQLNLKENGVFLSKFFMGSNFSEIKIKANTFFRKVIIFKPSSSRSESRESYIFCKKTFK